MSEVLIFDRAMCCSTGVCGAQVDPVLPRFAADLDWLAKQGHQVERFNLAHDAAEFTKNATVQALLSSDGVECLPLIMVDGQVVSRSDYPSRDKLALWTKTSISATQFLPISTDSESCCDGGDCC